jgi:hypothetical protein
MNGVEVSGFRGGPTVGRPAERPRKRATTGRLAGLIDQASSRHGGCPADMAFSRRFPRQSGFAGATQNGTVCCDNAAARLESTRCPRRSGVGLITLKEPMWILAVGANNTYVGIHVGPALVHKVPAIR